MAPEIRRPSLPTMGSAQITLPSTRPVLLLRESQVCENAAQNAMGEFAAFADRIMETCIGTDGSGDRQRYIPHRLLNDFWAPGRIRDVLAWYHPHRTFSWRHISGGFLRIFSILVYVNKVKYLDDFVTMQLRDEILERDDLPRELSGDFFAKVAKALEKYRWTFSPMSIDRDKLVNVRLSDKHILPFTVQEEINRNDSAVITKVVTREHGNPSRETSYVLKTYFAEAHNRYENEISAFAAMTTDNPHIIKCHGTFQRKNGTRNLLLQYIKGGHLGTFFLQTEKPRTETDVHTFWRSMWGVWRGVHGLQTYRNEYNSYQTIGTHQDLKPDNILISKGATDSPYDFVPVITDFGHSYVGVASENGDRQAPDQHGNQEFAAPEASRHAKYLRNERANITPDADVWSMGCILSVAAAWATLGSPGVDRYEQKRKADARSNPNFDGHGDSSCFHNGTGPSNAVAEMHEIISTGISADRVTREILVLLESKCMVGEPANRKTAKEIFESRVTWLDHGSHSRHNSQSALKSPRASDLSVIPQSSPTSGAAVNGNTAGSPSTPSSRAELSPGPSTPVQTRDSTRVGSPNLLREQESGTLLVGRSYSLKSRLRDFFRRSESAPDPFSYSDPQSSLLLTLDICYERLVVARKNSRDAEQPADIAIRALQRQLNNREYVFVIDDSRHMRAHKELVKKAIRTLACIAKPMDPNNIDIIFVSRPDKPYKLHQGPLLSLTGISPRVMMDIIDRLPFDHPPDLMEMDFGKVVTMITETLLASRPTSVFVLTDGKWFINENGSCGLENPIKGLMEATQLKSDRTRVMLQFLRFGDDPVGKSLLDSLDRFGNKYGWDIVDHKPITGDVRSMFRGSISPWSDREGEDQEPLGSHVAV